MDLVIEYAGGGELFDLVVERERFTEVCLSFVHCCNDKLTLLFVIVARRQTCYASNHVWVDVFA